MGLSITKEDWTEYVPAYGGNRDDAEPMTVEVHALTAGETRAYSRKAVSRLKGKADDQSMAKASDAAEAVTRMVFVENVRNIRGFSVNGEPMVDVGTFYDAAPLQLVQEIAQAIEDETHLSKGRRDRLTSQSGG